jgi:hypothetical protein
MVNVDINIRIMLLTKKESSANESLLLNIFIFLNYNNFFYFCYYSNNYINVP